MTVQPKERSKASYWIQAVRPFAYPASVVPILTGAMFTLAYYDGEIYWWLLPVIIVAGILFHTGTNLVSEYFDYRKGVDRPETYGSSKVLVDKLLKPRAVLTAGLFAFAIGTGLGMIIYSIQGTPILIIGLIGLAGGIFYSGLPFGYKYLALGDLFVFALMGPLMVIGTYISLTGHYDPNVLYVSLPVGFLVAAILHANNMRDIIHDSEAKIKTIAMLFGIRASKVYYSVLVFGAFVSVILMVIFHVLEFWTLIVLISLPVVLKNVKMIYQAEVNNPEAIMMADVATAQHHLMFGVLLSVGLLLTAII